MKYIINAIFLVLSGFSNAGFAQQQLDKYIQYGLVNNEIIKQHQFLLEKNLYSL